MLLDTVANSSSIGSTVIIERELAAKKAAGASILSLADDAMHELGLDFGTAMKLVQRIDVTNTENLNTIQLLRRANRTPFLVKI
jgi:hypothetical protein